LANLYFPPILSKSSYIQYIQNSFSKPG